MIDKSKASLESIIQDAQKLSPHEAIIFLMRHLQSGNDSVRIRLELAKSYLRYGIPSQTREYIKSIQLRPEDLSKEITILLQQTNRPCEYVPPLIDTLIPKKNNIFNDGKWVIASAASSFNFPQLIDLIGSLHRHCIQNLWKIVVYDLGLSDTQSEYLSQLAAVKVKKVPFFNPHALAWGTWKLWSIKDCAEQETAGPFLFCEAGVQILKDLSPIFDLIIDNGYGLWHSVGNFNRDWSTNNVYEKLGIEKARDTSLQVINEVQGYSSRGIVKAKLIDSAFHLAADEKLLYPSTDCLNNRHAISLLSLIVSQNGIAMSEPQPMIALENSDLSKSQEAIIWLCGCRTIGGHDKYLIKKSPVNMSSHKETIYCAALRLLETKEAKNIASGEEKLFMLTNQETPFQKAIELIKQSPIEHAFHRDIYFQAFFDWIIRIFSPSHIVETGTFLGWTTEFIALNYPHTMIWTTDSNKQFHEISKVRLARYSNIKQILKSSDVFLSEWLPKLNQEDKCIFFLDAHWENYWPLPQEIQLISDSQCQAIIIVDDFKVPGHNEYGYDDYGAGKVCDLSAVLPYLNPHNTYHALLPNYSDFANIRIAEHLRGRLILFQNADNLFPSAINDPWIQEHFSDATSQLMITKPEHGKTEFTNKKKIVALIPAKNEEKYIEFCLKAVAQFADAICILDDASNDKTVEIVSSLSKECNIERILRKEKWEYNETGYRQPLLEAGRTIGGTHFIIIDVDEAFTANLTEGNKLRDEILKLQPGDSLVLAWIQLWRSATQYRYDNSVWTNNYKAFIFADDGKCSYHQQDFHLGRIPANLKGNNFVIKGYQYGLMHFQFVNWRNLLIKQAWYRCLERIRNPEKSISDINALYAPSKDESNLGLKPSPEEWFKGYDFFDKSILDAPEVWREKQVLEWFEQYGKEYFKDLDIWDINWGDKSSISSSNLPELMKTPPDAEETAIACNIEKVGGWFTTPEILALYRLVRRSPAEAKILEIGSYRGKSTNAIGYAIKNSARELYCLDIWRNFEQQGIRQLDSTAHTLLTTDFGIFEDFLRQTEWFSEKIRILRGSTEQFSDFLLPGFFNIIFIDGAHDYENVHRDISISLKCLKPGGILCGHDYSSDGQGVIKAVNELIFSRSDISEHGVFDNTSIWFAKFSEKTLQPSPSKNITQLKSASPQPVIPSNEIRVSAIISTYNSERFMRGCLEDLIEQTLYQKGELEIIVIDSGSEQNEKAIVEEFQNTSENIIYVRTKRETVYAAWNRGIKLASGNYITNANADDRHRKDALEIMANTLDQNPDIGLVYADVIKTATENETFDHHTPSGAYHWKDYNREILTLCCYMGPQPMWRKALHDRYGYFDESFASSGDWEFWLRIAEGTQMLHIPEYLGLYLYSPQGAEHRDKEKRIREDLQIFQKYVPKYLSTAEDAERGLNALREMDQKRGESRLDDPFKNALIQLKQYTGGMKSPEQFTSDISVSREAFGEPTACISTSPKPFEEDKPRKQNTYRKDFVSIILLISGDNDATRKCIRNIRKHTPEHHEILFVPLDHSFAPPKWMRKLVKENENYSLVTPTGKNEGSEEHFTSNPPSPPFQKGGKDVEFSKGGGTDLFGKVGLGGILSANKPFPTFSEVCNAGITESIGDHILIINDGVVVTESWLSGMLDCLRRVDNAGIIGPMMTNVEGPQRIEIQNSRVQEVKGSSETENKERFRPSRNDKNIKETRRDSSSLVETKAREFRERNKHRHALVGRLKDACMLFRHDLADIIGLFDDRFRSPEFTVEDYCLRTSMEGFSNFIAGDVLISYAGDEITAAKKREIFKERRSFVSKWSVVDSQSLNSQKLHAVNALMASHEFSEKGDMNKALSILIDGLGSSPDDRRLHHALVELLVSQRQFRDALDVLDAVPDSLKNTVRWLEFAGICKEGMQEYDDADALADKILALNNKSPVALNLKGMKAYRQVNHADAEQLFREAIDADPGFGEAYANLGAVQWSAQNYEPAFTLLERAFILSPTAEAVATNYHSASVALERLERASFVFSEAAALHPSYKKLKYILADLLLQREQYQEAMDVIEKALLAFDMDDDSLALAGALREKIGPKEITKNKGNSLLIADSSYTTEETQKTQVTQRTQDTQLTTLSVCMIVKNEEKNIGKCLRNIKPLADEMIVVDTGSTDRTKDTAKVFGAKVYDFEWTNSFADARNYSISKATGDWVLILDADEAIAPSDFEKLRTLITSAKHEIRRDMTTQSPVSISLNESQRVSSSQVAYSLFSRNYVVSMNTTGWVGNDGTYLEQEIGTGWSPSKKVRLFPNDPRIRFEEPVHELVENSLNAAGIPIKDCEVPVHHYGKLDLTKVVKKGEQYYELGKSKFRSDDDLLAIYELAVQTSELGRFEEALRHWEKFVSLMPDFPKGFYGLGNAHYRLNHFQEAFSALVQAASIAQDHVEWRDAVILLAHAAIGGGRPGDCIEYLEQLLIKEPQYPMALLLLSVAHASAGEHEKGNEYLKQLEKLNFDGTPYFVYFAELLLSEQRVAPALSLLNMARNLGRMPTQIAALIAECERRIKEMQKTNEIHGDSVETETVSALRSQSVSLSVCMIVKNEEENIARALTNIKSLVDEMIVVDTGSTDRTKERAKNLGAKVYDFVWTDSFADARNFALSKATSAWILILDADEVISPSDHEALRQLVIPPTPPLEKGGINRVAYLFVTRNYVQPTNTAGWVANDGSYKNEEAGTGWFPGEKVRLFPNDKSLRFENPVHERIEPSLENLGIEIRQCPIPIHHYGMLDEDTLRTKNAYYYELGKKRLSEKGGNDFRAIYDLAVQASGIGRYGEALEYFQKAIALNPDFAKAYESLGNTYYNLKQYAQALSSYRKSLELNPSSCDAIMMSAQCEIIMGDPGRSVHTLGPLLKKNPAYGKALFPLVAAYVTLGQQKQAAKYVEEMKSNKSDLIGYLSEFAKLLLSQNKTREAQLLLDAGENIKNTLF
ncbi:MAG: glycosyltransferase [Thermodesulfovibrionales bacterium]|nr:glycosyltransferase [Thermodesulfovibrionales bacterium]